MDKEFIVDSFAVTFFVAKIESGVKTGEFPITLPRGFHAPDLTPLLAQAQAQARAQDDAANATS